MNIDLHCPINLATSFFQNKFKPLLSTVQTKIYVLVSHIFAAYHFIFSHIKNPLRHNRSKDQPLSQNKIDVLHHDNASVSTNIDRVNIPPLHKNKPKISDNTISTSSTLLSTNNNTLNPLFSFNQSYVERHLSSILNSYSSIKIGCSFSSSIYMQENFWIQKKYRGNIKTLTLETDDLTNGLFKNWILNFLCLKTLHLNCFRIATSRLVTLKKLRSSLRSLNFLETDTISQTIKHLKYFKHLEVLKLRQSGRGTENLMPLKSLNTLKFLTLSNINIKKLQNFRPAKSLQSLSLIDCNIVKNGLKHFKHLSALKITSNYGTQDDLVCLAGLTSLQFLTVLYHRDGDIKLKYLASVPSLKFLSLNHCNIADGELKHLTSVPFLQSLDLSMSVIVNEDLKYLVHLISLESLTLSWCEIANGEFKHLASLTSLKDLRLKRCKITDEEFKDLANLTSLHSLTLSYCEGITDKGLDYLKNSTALQFLDLSIGDDGITIDGLKHLAGLKCLQTLNLMQFFKFFKPKYTKYPINIEYIINTQRHLLGFDKLNVIFSHF